MQPTIGSLDEFLATLKDGVDKVAHFTHPEFKTITVTLSADLASELWTKLHVGVQKPSSYYIGDPPVLWYVLTANETSNASLIMAARVTAEMEVAVATFIRYKPSPGDWTQISTTPVKLSRAVLAFLVSLMPSK